MFIFAVRVNLIESLVLYIHGSSKLPGIRGSLYVVRVSFLVSGVLYIRGSSKLPGIGVSLYSWFE